MRKSQFQWEMRPLGLVATLQRGYDLPVQSRRVGPYPIFAANGPLGFHDEAMSKGPGVVTGRSGSIGKVYLVAESFWPLNTALWVKDFHGNNPEWVRFLLEWFDLSRFARGAAVPTLDRKLVHSELVPVPPIDEQAGIVLRIKDCLDRVDEIDSLRKETMREARAVLPSVLNEVFASQTSTAPLKSIGELATETRYGTSQKCHSEPSGIPILRIPNVAGGAVNYERLKYCNLDATERVRVRLEKGDLLFVRTNGSRDLVGRCAVFEPDDQTQTFGFASYLIRVRVDQSTILPRYLAYFLNSTNGRSELDSRRRTSAGQFNINSENLRSIPLPVPTIAVQEKLLDQMEQRESQAIHLVSELGAIESESEGLRKSILRKAFAGEL